MVVTDLVETGRATAAVAALMSTPNPPTAVIALNLGISDGVLLDRVSQRREYAFIAFDESELYTGLGVSAVVRDPQEIGRQAAILALARHADPEGPGRTVTVGSRLVRRGTGEIPA